MRKSVASLMPQLRSELERLVRIPSIAFPGFPPEPLFEAHDQVAELLRSAGVEQVGRLEIEGKTAPVVIAEIPAPRGAPTVVLYTHYDVVPAGDEALWHTPPFEPVTREGADLAVTLGRERGFGVEVFDEQALAELGCGGLLGVNRGSVEPPRLIKLSYQPRGEPTGRLALVGKGIMYDSGGISLKPSDPIHAQMKNDMSGAAAILAAVAPLAEVGCTAAVTGFLMCTDNMPSGSAMALGDVLTIRDGTTVEVIDTDAEGRLAMSDGLALAAEEAPDAIVDIATLTGSCQRALGPDMAGVVGNHQAMVDQVKAAAEATGERVWQLPLHRPYRRLLDSGVADLMNVAPVGLPDAIIASLFLAEFVGDIPWAHLDIAGTAQADTDDSWRPKGVTGFGARLLLDLALRFTQPGS